MLRTEKIVDRFDRIEGDEGNFDENGMPVRHGAIPQAR